MTLIPARIRLPPGGQTLEFPGAGDGVEKNGDDGHHVEKYGDDMTKNSEIAGNSFDQLLKTRGVREGCQHLTTLS